MVSPGSMCSISSVWMRTVSWSASGTPSSEPITIAGNFAANSCTKSKLPAPTQRVEVLGDQLADARLERRDAPRA